MLPNLSQHPAPPLIFDTNERESLLDQAALEYEIQSLSLPDPLAALLEMPSRVLLHSASIVLVPSVSPIVPDHCLLFSRRPYTNFGDAITESASMASDVEAACDKYREAYGALMLFEHGVPSKEFVACGINWAHLHLTPLGTDIGQKLVAELEKTFGPPIPEEPDPGSPYVKIKLDDGRLYSWNPSTVPSQIIRQTLARIVGNPQWDWRQLFGLSEVRSTVRDWQLRQAYGFAVI